MTQEIQHLIAACEWAPSYFLIFSENVFAPLVYYSHIGATLPAIAIVVFIYINNRKRLDSLLLLLMILCFSGWVLSDMVLWATEFPAYTMFFWSLLIVLEPLVYFFAFYFICVHIKEKDWTIKQKILFFTPLIPTLLLVTTDLGLSGFDLSNCDRAATEGPLAKYGYFIEFVYVLLILGYGIITALKEADTDKKRGITLLTLGIVLLLLSFSFGNIIEVFTENWLIGQYGLFGAPIFTGFLAYIIVKYKAFNAKLIASQALVFALWFLVLAILFLRSVEAVRIVVLISLLFLTILGANLIRSVISEVRQREKIESLAKDLSYANNRLRELDKQKSEFVSIASHQLRSPLTAIRGYASMLAEGSFGNMPAKATETASRIEEAAKLMAISIEDYLNISRIEAGNMKYNLSDFNLMEMVDTICDGVRAEAMKKGLALLFRSDISSRALVNADIGKTNQIIHNLINNSIKYTPSGSVSVLVRDDVERKKIYVDITDTGIGMSQETIAKLFHKFSRADNANTVNVSGTGLGLFVAAKMAEAMGGEVKAQSEGDGKGSTFTFTLPLAM